jgi:hypothetical protein
VKEDATNDDETIQAFFKNSIIEREMKKSEQGAS